MKHLNFLSKSSSQSCGHNVVTLASTVGSPSAHRRGTLLKLLSVLVLIFTLGIGNVWGSNWTGTSTTKAPAGTYKAMVANEAVVAGDTVIIVSGSGNSAAAMSTTQNNNNRSTITVSESSSTVVLDGTTAVQALEVAASSVSGKWTLHTADGYLYAPSYSSSTNNYLKTETTDKSGYGGDWTIAYNNVEATGNGTRRFIRRNGTLISCYASGAQTAITVYKKAHKVLYQGNGGSTSCSDNTFYKSNAEVTLCASEPTRSNYTFTGWTATIALTNATTDANIAAGTLIPAGTHIVMPAKDVVLTAQWESAASSDPALELTGSGAFGNVDVDDTKDLDFTLTGANLTANASVSVSGTGFSLITPAGGSLTQTAGSITGSNNITVRFAPTAGGAHNGTLTVSSAGAEDVSISLSGTGILYDHFIDEVQNTTGYTGAGMAKGGDYSEDLPTIADKDAGSGNCQALHYHFCGWVTEANRANPHGHLATITGTASGETYYAVWAKAGTGGTSYTQVTSISEGVYVMVSEKTSSTYRYMPNTTSSSSNPALGTGITMSTTAGVTTLTNAVTDAMLWDFTLKSGSVYYIRPHGSTTIGLGTTTSGGANIRISESYKNMEWTIATSNSYGWQFKNNASTNMYLAVYADDYWRCYNAAGTNQYGKFYLFKQNLSYADSITVCCNELGSINGSVNLNRWVKNLCGCKGTVFLRDMQIN